MCIVVLIDVSLAECSAVLTAISVWRAAAGCGGRRCCLAFGESSRGFLASLNLFLMGHLETFETAAQVSGIVAGWDYTMRIASTARLSEGHKNQIVMVV